MMLQSIMLCRNLNRALLMVYTGKDNFANYTLSYDDRILLGVVTGPIGFHLATKYDNDLEKILKTIPDKYFGYIGDLSNCQAYTVEAVSVLQLSHRRVEQAGCVVDAYCVGTALSIEQLKRLRAEARNPAPLEDRVFENQNSCKTFIQSILSKIEYSNEPAERATNTL